MVATIAKKLGVATVSGRERRPVTMVTMRMRMPVRTCALRQPAVTVSFALT
jgi:hypothetical protein